MVHISTGQAVVESLIRHGVDTVFGMPGAQTYDLFDAFYEARKKIRVILVRHEQAAAYMAFGYARSTGKVGVFCVVPGPGVLNTMAALCTAHGANQPILCLTSEVPSDFIGKGRRHLHELPDQLGSLRSLLKWAEQIDQPQDAPAMVNEAFVQMQSGRPGPVSLQIPWDTLGATGEVDLLDPIKIPRISATRSEIRAAAELISQSKMPMIYVGGGALHAGEEVIRLAEIIGAPVASFRSGRGVVSDDHPLTVMLPVAAELWEETDLVIGVGSRLEGLYMRWNMMQWQERPREPKVIRIDIDPKEMKYWPPDQAVVGDAKPTVGALAAELDKRGLRYENQTERISKAKSRVCEAINSVQPQIALLEVIREILPRDGFITGEMTQVGFTSQVAFPVYEPRTYVTCGHQDTLGYGFPTALGVKVANPDKVVISITGDGGFQFAIQELATAKQFNINLITIVFNNSAYGNVRRDQETRFGGRVIGADLVNPDFLALARAYGVQGYQTQDADGLREVLRVAVVKDEPAVIEVILETGSEVSPWPFILRDAFTGNTVV